MNPWNPHPEDWSEVGPPPSEQLDLFGNRVATSPCTSYKNNTEGDDDADDA